MKDKKKNIEKEIDPNSFYGKIEGVYDHPKKEIGIKIKRSLEDIQRKKEIKNEIEQENKPVEIMPSKFDSKQYKETANKKLEEAGSNVRVYNKVHHNTILIILIGVIIIFGLFFVWSVSNDKFKSDFDCPNCNCPQLTCPEIDFSKINNTCICNPVFNCSEINMTPVIDAINNLNFSNNSG